MAGLAGHRGSSMENPMRIRLNKRTLAFLLIFLVGLSILLYPLISSTYNQILANRLMDGFDETVSEMDPNQVEDALEEAHKYNERLLPKKVPDAFTIRQETSDLEYESLLNVTGDGMMGYVEIPAINTKSPIYHYTTEEVLKKGVGHLFGSSLPVGGNGTHTVLTAHRGLPNNKLFTDLDKVVKGDKFFITILNETIAYQVDQILVVEPNQTEALALTDGKDYATLVTCTPYGVNTHRILCRGHRIPYVPSEKDEEARSWINMNILIALIGAVLGILIAIILARRLRKRNKQTSTYLDSDITDSAKEITEPEQDNTILDQEMTESDE